MPHANPARSVVSRIVAELVDERKRQAVSMNRLAEMTGLSLTSISYVERGLRNPSLETVLRIALALGANLPELMQRSMSSTTKAK